MVTADFDREIDRKGTGAAKWEFVQVGENLVPWEDTDSTLGENRVLPLWVADMDFPCPQPVVKALIARAAHGIYGYSEKTDAYCQSVVNWMQKRHGWKIAPEWICTTPGVVPALHMLVRTFVAPGEKVLIQPPVYHPFFTAVQNNGAQLVTNPLLYQDGRYRMDYADLEEKAQDPQVRMALLCSPHNPVGRVWTSDELVRFGDICLAHDVLMVSDEIHGDVIYKGHTLTPLASISQELAQQAIICTAPSKTFNMAGLQTSNILIPNDDLRARFKRTLRSHGWFGMNAFGVVAVQVAYDSGEEWLTEVLDYLEDNLSFLQDYVSQHIPLISVIPPEGTYLVWLDCRRLGLDRGELTRLMLNDARVYLSDGFVFGVEGEGFQRINIACPRSILAKALERIKQAIDRL